MVYVIINNYFSYVMQSVNIRRHRFLERTKPVGGHTAVTSLVTIRRRRRRRRRCRIRTECLAKHIIAVVDPL